MRLHVCGARGSIPTPGAQFVRFGGDTSCIAVTPRGGTLPTLILDTGSGARRAAKLFDGHDFEGTILLSHLHWDHTQGLPFFGPGDREGARADLFIPEQDGDAMSILARAMSPPHFPIGPDGLRGDWTFGSIEEGDHPFEGFSVRAREVPHKGGRTFGYRVGDGETSFAYVPDHHPTSYGPGPDGFGEVHDAILALVEGVDVLFHDAQHTAEEFPSREAFGHAAIDYSVRLAREAGVPRLLLFHHDPNRTDDDLDHIVDALSGDTIRIEAASAGSVLDLVPAP